MNVRRPYSEIRPVPISAVEGTAVNVPVATFIHPDSSRRASDFRARINWGDGISSDGTVSSSGSAFTVSGSHTYTDEGAYMVWVTVTDRVTDLESVAISNISDLTVQHEAESVIVVDPTDPNRVFAATVSVSRGAETAGSQEVLVSYSDDGGVTWTRSSYPGACCHPTAAFDQFGNLFFAYRGEIEDIIHVALSPDGGKTFPFENSFVGPGDYPSIATGPGRDGAPGSVWIGVELPGAGNSREIGVYGFSVNGKDPILEEQGVPFDLLVDDEISRNFPGIAIGPARTSVRQRTPPISRETSPPPFTLISIPMDSDLCPSDLRFR